MKPAAFDYVAPGTVAEAVALLADEPDARVIAGGQSLMQLLNRRLTRARLLIGLDRVQGLDEITIDDGILRIGAMTRQRVLERHPLVAEHAPVLAAVLDQVSSVAVRNRGTVGGSLANADRSAELPLTVVALGGAVVAAGPRGERTIAADELFTAHLTTTLRRDEVLTQVRLPVGDAPRAFGFCEATSRLAHWAAASALALVGLDGDGRLAEVRLAVGGAHPVPLRVAAAEARLRGSAATDQKALEEAARLTTEALDPPSDLHGTADYRRAVTGVLVRRALAEAVERARKEPMP